LQLLVEGQVAGRIQRTEEVGKRCHARMLPVKYQFANT
jgi:hypothetical protein